MNLKTELKEPRFPHTPSFNDVPHEGRSPLKTICQGALGALTFGAYYQYTTNKTIELNNEKIETQYKHFMNKMENQHKKEMIEMLNQQKILNIKLERIVQ